MVEGLYRGWDELRSVPAGSQSGLRVIVLFTDGASNSVPGDYGTGPGVGLRTYDFPQNRRRYARPDLGQPAHHGPVRHRHGGQHARASTRMVAVGLHRHALHGEHRVAEVSAGRERAHASSKRRHPDVVSAADGVAEGERRAADERAGPEELRRGGRKVSRRGLQHQQRGAQSRRDHRQRRAQRQRRLPHPHLHDRHGPAGAAGARDQAGDVGEHAQAHRQRRPVVARTSTAPSSKASTSTRRRPPTWARRSRACRTRFFA